MARSPSPESIHKAAKVLRRLAAQERLNDDHERAEVLDHAAEICEAKAFVGVIAQAIDLDDKLTHLGVPRDLRGDR